VFERAGKVVSEDPGRCRALGYDLKPWNTPAQFIDDRRCLGDMPKTVVRDRDIEENRHSQEELILMLIRVNILYQRETWIDTPLGGC
jgi:hypothetical protein